MVRSLTKRRTKKKKDAFWIFVFSLLFRFKAFFFFLEHPRKISLKVFKGKVCTTADSWVSLLAFVFISKHVGLCDEDD